MNHVERNTFFQSRFDDRVCACLTQIVQTVTDEHDNPALRAYARQTVESVNCNGAGVEYCRLLIRCGSEPESRSGFRWILRERSRQQSRAGETQHADTRALAEP